MDADPGRAKAIDAEIEGRGLLDLIGYGLRWAREWVVEALAELVFGWW